MLCPHTNEKATLKRCAARCVTSCGPLMKELSTNIGMDDFFSDIPAVKKLHDLLQICEMLLPILEQHFEELKIFSGLEKPFDTLLNVFKDAIKQAKE